LYKHWRSGISSQFERKTHANVARGGAGGVDLALSVVAQQQKAMTPLFNGKDLSGWNVPSPGATFCWKVVDGMLVGDPAADPSGKVSDLYTTKSYKDIEFETEYRCDVTADSGVNLRKPMVQVQIGLSNHLKVDKTGSLYAEATGEGYVADSTGVDKVLKANDWNKLRFVAKGDKLTVWLNGTQVLDCSLAKYMGEAPIGLQLHAGPKMKIEFRNMNMRELE
jgi:hypothetical protein